MVILTRTDHAQLGTELQKVVELLDQASGLLSRLPQKLTDEERRRIPKPTHAFANAARTLAAAAEQHADLAAMAGFDPEAVLEDLDNVDALAAVAQRLEALSGRVSDAILRWRAEAFAPSLALYGMAKVRARTDGELQTLVDPLGEIFARGRKRRAATRNESG